MDVGIQGLTG